MEMTIDQLPSPVSQNDFINGAQFDYQYFKKTLPSCLWALSIQLELTGWNFWLRESVNDILKLLVEVTQIVLKFSVHCLSLEPTWRSGDVYL